MWASRFSRTSRKLLVLPLSCVGLITLARCGAAQNNQTPSATPPQSKSEMTPILREISPHFGLAKGGTRITLRGDNFKEGSEISFCHELCINPVFRPHSIECTSTSGDPDNDRSCKAEIRSPGSDSTVSSGDLFTFQLTPTFSVNATPNPDGSANITLLGKGLDVDSQVSFWSSGGSHNRCDNVQYEDGLGIVGTLKCTLSAEAVSRLKVKPGFLDEKLNCEDKRNVCAKVGVTNSSAQFSLKAQEIFGLEWI